MTGGIIIAAVVITVTSIIMNSDKPWALHLLGPLLGVLEDIGVKPIPAIHVTIDATFVPASQIADHGSIIAVLLGCLGQHLHIVWYRVVFVLEHHGIQS